MVFRFFFYSNEAGEAAHVHVQRERMLAKVWLEPVMLASSIGFAAKELNKVLKLVEDNAAEFREAWNEYFGD